MTNPLQFNYVVINRDGTDFVGRVLEEPTYKKIDLDPTEAYMQAHIPEGISTDNYPGLFDNSKKKDTEYPTPFRKVMCRINVCDFCDKTVESDNIHQEYTDISNHMGYFYCSDCKDHFTECLQRTGTRNIWYLRTREEDIYKYDIWVPRTRRDENGNKIKHGSYTFEKWRICGWYAYDLEDENGIIKPHITCENPMLTKSVPIDFILELNPENDPNYNPNNDPKWQ